MMDQTMNLNEIEEQIQALEDKKRDLLIAKNKKRINMGQTNIRREYLIYISGIKSLKQTINNLAFQIETDSNMMSARELSDTSEIVINDRYQLIDLLDHYEKNVQMYMSLSSGLFSEYQLDEDEWKVGDFE